MKFIVFNGSPAGADSNTNVIAAAFLKGAKRGGAETENIFLIDRNIGHCRGCFTCWFRTPGKCIFQDEMDELLPKYMGADVVCFASPVYTWNVTAVLKNFVDRLVCLKSPLIVSSGDDFDLADAAPKTQQFVAISNCGFPGDNNFETMKAVFAACAPTLEIYRNCGKLLKTKDTALRAVVDKYLQIVEQAGFELASSGNVCEETKKNLEMQLMPVADYIKYIGM